MKKKSGFTLIELIITITIIALMAGGGAVSLNSFNARQKVESAKEDVVTNLKLAKNYATSMQLPSSLEPGKLDSVRVTFTGGTIKVEAVRAGDSQTATYFEPKVIVPSTLTLTTNQNTFDFMAYKGNIRGSAGIGITLRSNEVGSSAMVLITNSGLINGK